MFRSTRMFGSVILLSCVLIVAAMVVEASDGVAEAQMEWGAVRSSANDSVPLAGVEISSNLITFQPLIRHSQVRVTVTGPEGFQAIRSFSAAEIPLVELPGLDGFYKYELRFAPVLDDETVAALKAARLKESEPIETEAMTDTETVQSGAFTIANGSVVPNMAEPSPKTVLTTANGVIRNALCVGFDCPDAPVFDDSSYLMMENNNRIKIGDTSNSPFPNNDWEIEANSNLSGGANYLGFNDCGTADNDGGCATDLVFAVEAGARQSALYVESDGDIGIGTSNPVQDIHVITGNTPSLRLDQDGSSGFAPQVWDIAGNESNFFIRDVTNGSTLPFRIIPGASSSSLVIASDGAVGIGAGTSPSASLHVKRTNGTAQLFIEEASGTETARTLFNLENNGVGYIRLTDTSPDGSGWTFQAEGPSFRFNKAGTGGAEIFVRSRNDGTSGQATLTVDGSVAADNVTFTSSRWSKAEFLAVDSLQVLQKVIELPISEWTFKDELNGRRHIGPMAEEFAESFALGGSEENISLIDASGVTLAAIQGLYEMVQQKETMVESLRAENEELNRRLEKLEAAVGALTQEN